MQLTIRFRGVRGSLPTPGIHSHLVGGNTSCVEVEFDDQRVILDAGTGLKAIGDELAKRGPSSSTILLSHLHWDHIQGIPFFAPIYQPGSRIQIASGPNGVMPLREALTRQMSAPFFPVSLADVAPQIVTRDLGAFEKFRVGEARISVARLNHPDPVYGYRIDVHGRSVVYATDTEHFSCVDPTLRRLCEGADVLIYDAQYTPEEYRGDGAPAKVGWGHSTYVAACELALAAGVSRLVLFHHDPTRTDAQVADLERRCRALFPNAMAAREGHCINLKLASSSQAA